MTNIRAQNIPETHFSNTCIHEVEFSLSWVLLRTDVTIELAVENTKTHGWPGSGGGSTLKSTIYIDIYNHLQHSLLRSFMTFRTLAMEYTLIYFTNYGSSSVCIHVLV
jgi:hypothetical protein